MQPPRVFLDTSARRHAVRHRYQYRPVPGAPIYRLTDEDPTSRIEGELRKEIDCLDEVATMARNGRITLLTSGEAMLEFLINEKIPNNRSSPFAGIAIEYVEQPATCERILGGFPGLSSETVTAQQIRFFESLDDKRFLQIQRACGAYQGSTTSGKQIRDAFHLWCAEFADASHFLTTDLKLIRLVRNYKTAPLCLKVVKPSELLLDIGNSLN
jgi:hypothetical protein